MSLEQIQAFLEASEELRFQAKNRQERYAWVGRTLVEQEYARLSRAGKGLVRPLPREDDGVEPGTSDTAHRAIPNERGRAAHGLSAARVYETVGKEDIALLVEVDEAHETLSGPATQKVLQREYHDFHDRRFANLARLSMAHLYRLRASRSYRQQRVIVQPTRPSPASIGERRRPEPRGRPGYLRIDTVHQGDDLDGTKGVCHINAVDEVTQWEVVGATPQISEGWLPPVLEAMLTQFPFVVRGFHSDCGSEFINHRVAKLLNKMLIEQTKSRPRHSNDKGLVEAKNGAVVRKHMGHWHIAASEAEAITAFYCEYLNPYLNFHRPCAVPEVITEPKGKQKRRYRWYATPWQILRQLPGIAGYLRPGITIAALDQQAAKQSDTAAAREMHEAKRRLFAGIKSRAKRTA